VKKAVSAVALALLAMAVQVPAAGATDTPCPTPSAASATRVTCPAAAAANPNQALYDQLRTRLGGDLAGALTTQQKLMSVLNQTSAGIDILNNQIAQEETVISNLQDQIAQLDTQIADTQARIAVEKEQVAAMAQHLRAVAANAVYQADDIKLERAADVSAHRLARQLAGIFDRVAA